MTFGDLRSALKKLNCEVKSDAVEFFFEAVFGEDQRAALEECLEAYFGPPFKAKGQPSNPESDAFAGRYGGAQENQTLYVKKKESGSSDIALIWPWRSGGRHTLKLIRG